MEIITGGRTALPQRAARHLWQASQQGNDRVLDLAAQRRQDHRPEQTVFYSHRHTATSYLRNTRLPDGSPAVKEDIERYILGHAGKGRMLAMASGGSRH